MRGKQTRTLIFCCEGPFALFTIPTFKVEKVTYDAMTPTAARGIVQAILWKPAVQVDIESIDVCNPIRHATIKINGVGHKTAMPSAGHMEGTRDPVTLVTNVMADRIQHQHTMLLDVRYVVRFRYYMTDEAGEGDNPLKFEEMFEKRIRRGQQFRLAHFGMQQHVAHCREVRADDVPLAYENRDLGMMPHYRIYHDESVDTVWFRAALDRGRMHVPSRREAEMRGPQGADVRPDASAQDDDHDALAQELEALERRQRLEREELERMQARDRAELARKNAARKRR